MHVSRRLTIVGAVLLGIAAYVVPGIMLVPFLDGGAAVLWYFFSPFAAVFGGILVGAIIAGLAAAVSWICTGDISGLEDWGDKMVLAWHDWWVWQPKPKPQQFPFILQFNRKYEMIRM